MASKHLKETEGTDRQPHRDAAHGAHEASASQNRKKTSETSAKAPPSGDEEPSSASPETKPHIVPVQPQEAAEEDSQSPRLKMHRTEDTEDIPPAPDKKRVFFRRVRAKEEPSRESGGPFSQRDAVSAIVALIAAIVLLAAAVVVWIYRDNFSADNMVLYDDTATPEDEFVFDAGSGESFAAAGNGLAVANSSGLELLNSEGTAVTSKLMQMENPTADGCEDFAIFYDLGGTKLAVARFDGTVEEIPVSNEILSATVSRGGYISVTTEYTGRRALVTVYDPNLDEIYEWFSSSAWVLSACVSPDGEHLAVLSYTTTGSEVRFFDLNRESQQAAFSVDDTILLDLHWFNSNRLCALSGDQVFFFTADGTWQNTYAFAGQYLVGYTFDGANCAAIALSPYRTGTTATLVTLDPAGQELGTAQVDSAIVCLAASDLEVLVLCSDGAILYNSSLAEKSRLSGLPGFKYALLRSRGEALLIATNYAEVYSF